MDTADLRETRLRTHLLTAPAEGVVDAATRMLAVQAQEFWSGRWALGVRTRGDVTISEVDALFDEGVLVRTTALRGTLHVMRARDLAGILAVTGERQLRQAAGRRRGLGLDDDVLGRAERTIMTALRGGGRLTRAELFTLLDGAGIDPAAQRGVHVLYALAARGLIVQGPVVHRDDAISREQYFVRADEWLPDGQVADEPVAELFARYLAGRGPATAADFAWWAGLPVTAARAAAAAATDRVDEIDDGVFVMKRFADEGAPAGTAVEVFALPSFDEYYVGYADRTSVCTPEHAEIVAPGKNGLLRPMVVDRGEIVGIWNHSKAVGRHREQAVPELFDGCHVAADDIARALDRYHRFISG